MTAAAGPQLPATKATPERLVNLLVNIAGRLERLEGISDRLAEHVERVERRFDGHEVRVVAIADRVALLVMLAGNTPSRGFLIAVIVSGMSGVILLFGIVATLLRHFPSIAGYLP